MWRSYWKLLQRPGTWVILPEEPDNRQWPGWFGFVRAIRWQAPTESGFVARATGPTSKRVDKIRLLNPACPADRTSQPISRSARRSWLSQGGLPDNFPIQTAASLWPGKNYKRASKTTADSGCASASIGEKVAPAVFKRAV